MLSSTHAMVFRAAPTRREIRELFIAGYARFAPCCRAVEEPSVTLVAIDELRGHVDGILTVAARPGAITTAVVGRHDRADLRLEAHEDLALRHLALIVEPATTFARGSAEVTYRLLDLRTGGGFRGEHDVPLVAVRCGGTAFFRCAGYTLLALATGDASDWPDDPEDAWDMIPERVFLGERAPRAPRASRPAGEVGCTTLVTAQRAVREPVLACGDPVALIELAGRPIAVDETALADGILIGRYPRCDGASLIDDQTVSRAHLLIIAIAGVVHAIDVASTHGTRVGGIAVRAVALGAESCLHLAGELEIRWSRFASPLPRLAAGS